MTNGETGIDIDARHATMLGAAESGALSAETLVNSPASSLARCPP